MEPVWQQQKPETVAAVSIVAIMVIMAISETMVGSVTADFVMVASAAVAGAMGIPATDMDSAGAATAGTVTMAIMDTSVVGEVEAVDVGNRR